MAYFIFSLTVISFKQQITAFGAMMVSLFVLIVIERKLDLLFSTDGEKKVCSRHVESQKRHDNGGPPDYPNS